MTFDIVPDATAPARGTVKGNFNNFEIYFTDPRTAPFWMSELTM